MLLNQLESSFYIRQPLSNLLLARMQSAEDVPLMLYPSGDSSASNSAEQAFTYKLTGRPAFSSVNITLKDNQKVLADAGAMQWMDNKLRVSTSCRGGCWGGCQRSMTGESCCLNTFTGSGDISFAFPEMGDMMPFALTPESGWLLTQKAFICGTDNLKVGAGFPGCQACCCGGEGAFLTKVTTNDARKPAMFFAGGYGEIVRHDVPEGKTLFVDNGLFFAAPHDVKFKIGYLGSVKTLCFGGEGFVMKFHGPSVVFTQSRNPSLFGVHAAQTKSSGN